MQVKRHYLLRVFISANILTKHIRQDIICCSVEDSWEQHSRLRHNTLKAARIKPILAQSAFNFALCAEKDLHDMQTMTRSNGIWWNIFTKLFRRKYSVIQYSWKAFFDARLIFRKGNVRSSSSLICRQINETDEVWSKLLQTGISLMSRHFEYDGGKLFRKGSDHQTVFIIIVSARILSWWCLESISLIMIEDKNSADIHQVN